MCFLGYYLGLPVGLKKFEDRINTSNRENESEYPEGFGCGSLQGDNTEDDDGDELEEGSGESAD